MKNIQVVYIAGVGRSGSTILDRILGTLDGVSSFNEIYRLWLEGFIENNICSCGEHFHTCSFWVSVVQSAFGVSTDIDRIMALHDRVDHSRHFFKIYTGVSSQGFKNDLEEYKGILRKLYFTIAEQSNSNIIVDSSKVPSRALILNQIPGINVHVIHMIRDVRAVAHAWGKSKFNPATGQSLVQYKPSRSVRFWLVRNSLCELLRYKMPYSRLLYENFAKHPRTVLQSFLGDVEPLASKRLPFEDEKSICLNLLHSMGGNPHRFAAGVTEIQFDEQWVKKINPATKRLATCLAYPMLYRYGYI